MPQLSFSIAEVLFLWVQSLVILDTFRDTNGVNSKCSFISSLSEQSS